MADTAVLSTPVRLPSVRSLGSDSLARNALGIMASTGSTAGLGFAFWTLAARVLPQAEVGVAATVVPAMGAAALLASLGWSVTLVGELPGLEAWPARWASLFWGAVAAAMAATVPVAALVLVALAHVSPELVPGGLLSPQAALFVAGAVATSVHIVLDAAFVACRAGGCVATRAAIGGILKLPLLLVAAGLAAAVAGAGATAIVSSWVVATSVSVLWGLLRLLPVRQPGASPVHASLGAAVRLHRGFLVDHIAGLGGMLPAYVLPVMVAARVGPRHSAYFYVTWMVGSAVLMVSPAVSSALFADGVHEPDRLGRTVRRAAVGTVGVLAPVTLVACSIGGLVLSVFGADYASHGRILLVLVVVSALPDAVTNLAVAVLRARRRPAVAAAVNLVTAGVTLVLAWLLLPRLGIAGAGVAWLAAQLVGVGVVGLIGAAGGFAPRSLWEQSCASST